MKILLWDFCQSSFTHSTTVDVLRCCVYFWERLQPTSAAISKRLYFYWSVQTSLFNVWLNNLLKWKDQRILLVKSSNFATEVWCWNCKEKTNKGSTHVKAIFSKHFLSCLFSFSHVFALLLLEDECWHTTRNPVFFFVLANWISGQFWWWWWTLTIIQYSFMSKIHLHWFWLWLPKFDQYRDVCDDWRMKYLDYEEKEWASASTSYWC